MRPYQTFSDLEDLFAKHRGHLRRKGVRLKPIDNHTVRDVYLQWVLLGTDLGYFSLCSNRAVQARIISDLMNRDVFEVVNTFAECVDSVRNQDITGFKARLSLASPHIWGCIKNDVSKISAGDTSAARRLIQLFSYTTRLSLTKLDLRNESLRDYLATEEAIRDEFPVNTLRALNGIIKRWMKPFDESNLVFKHGNGSVAGHKLAESTLETKYRDLFDDALTRYAFPQYESSGSSIVTAPARISQTVFVPKSYKAFRTISKEPATLMYLQQGILGEIDRVILTNPYLKARIDMHYQPRNQEMARIGSLLRNYATIDLSAASDSVSWTLVKELFRGTKLLRYLFATRSTHTFLPNRQYLKLKKFAPMGSALCFPIETIIFAAICEYTTRKVSRLRREQSISADYSVYGDDIIVPTQAAAETVRVLNEFGFSVNQSKSFIHPDSWFRESCGGEYCNGDDVSPMRVSRNYLSELDGAALTGCIESANEAFSRGFKNLRHFFLKKLRRHKEFIPLFSETSLLSDNYTNHHTKKKWNRELHRWEYRVSYLYTEHSPADEVISLRHWLEATQTRKRVYEAFESHVGERKTGLRIDLRNGPQDFEIPAGHVVERNNPSA